MPQTIELEVITSTDVLVKASIAELYIPAYYGQAGILEYHLPYISVLKAGEVAYRDTQGIVHYLFIHDGFLKTLRNKITIISDRVEMEEDLDKSEIESRQSELARKIKAAPQGDITVEELDRALAEQKEIKIKVDILKKIEQK